MTSPCSGNLTGLFCLAGRVSVVIVVTHDRDSPWFLGRRLRHSMETQTPGAYNCLHTSLDGLLCRTREHECCSSHSSSLVVWDAGQPRCANSKVIIDEEADGRADQGHSTIFTCRCCPPSRQIASISSQESMVPKRPRHSSSRSMVRRSPAQPVLQEGAEGS